MRNAHIQSQLPSTKMILPRVCAGTTVFGCGSRAMVCYHGPSGIQHLSASHPKIQEGRSFPSSIQPERFLRITCFLQVEVSTVQIEAAFGFIPKNALI